MNEQDAFDQLLEKVASLHSREELRQFFYEILTVGEIRDIGMRWTLLKRLVAGESQRKIAQDLKISLCKITRGSKILKENGMVATLLKTQKVTE